MLRAAGSLKGKVRAYDLLRMLARDGPLGTGASLR
jgi:hypothetical protein